MTTSPVLVQMIFAAKGAATIWAYIGTGRNVDCLDVPHQITLATKAVVARTILPSALQTGAVVRTSRRSASSAGRPVEWPAEAAEWQI